MNLQEIKEKVNLREYAYRWYGLKCNSKGLAKCPFHGPDNHPSFAINFDDGIWKWFDPHDNTGGTIIDFEIKFGKYSKKEAIETLLSRFRGEPATMPDNQERTIVVKTIPYIYRNLEGNEILRKEKRILSNGEKTFIWYHKTEGVWKAKMGPYSHVPYLLNEFKNFKQVIVCEGEKDADTLNDLDIGEFATTAPTGAGGWPENITQYFEGFERITFLYDTGNEAHVERHASLLKLRFKDISIFIATVPMEEKESDITDYLETQSDKAMALLDILDKAREFKAEDITANIREDYDALTIEELATMQIPEIDWIVKPIVERFGYTLLGGQKGVGKSLLATQIGFYASSGFSPFIVDEITIDRPVNVLLVQQEVSLAGMKDRQRKMREEKLFNTEGRFRIKTTTGAWWNLTKPEDYDRLKRLLEKFKPDLLILDPLYTFCPRELNTSGDVAPMLQIISDLKTNFNLGLVVIHHFSNKENPDEIRISVGRFMGHSMIANSADVTIGLDFLHPKYRQTNLPLPYQNYITTEITTRHGEWPHRIALERHTGCLLFQESAIWQDLGRSLIPGQVEDLLVANDGEMLQKDIIQTLSSHAKATTIKRALYEAEKRGAIIKQILPGKGKPVLWILAK